MNQPPVRDARPAAGVSPPVQRRRGSILIVALGVLTLLAVLGATFAQLMSLEKKAVDNFVDAQRMDLLTNSAIDQVIARLHDYSNRRSWSAYANLPWLYLLRDEQDLAHGRADVGDPRVGSWTVYSEMAGRRFRYKTKVIDCASQIDLNGRQDTLARMLDNLGEAIERSSRLKREKGRLVTNPFYTGPNRSGQRVRGIDIMLFRQRLEGQRFESKLQLRQLIGNQNYQIVKDFLTCHSWEDPYTYRADDGDNEVPDLASGGTTVAVANAGQGLGGGGAGLAQPRASDQPRLAHEPRHPINVNTAPEEVLIACLMGLGGRRLFPFSNLGGAGGSIVPVDQNANILGERILFGQEEVFDVRPRAIFVYSQKLEYVHAQRIAQEIISRRKDPRTAFRAWRTNDITQPGFEDFVDGLAEDFFPSVNNVLVIDPEQPNDRSIRARVTSGGGSPVGRLWVKGTTQGAARSLLRNRGLPVHDANAWYYEMMKGIIKANANPNTRINRYNPNVPVYIPVDKSDLVWAETRELLKKGHTTEFCFDSMGEYEITTLGEMVDLSRVGGGVGAGGGRTTVASHERGSGGGRGRTVTSGAGGNGGFGAYYPFRRQVRTVVEIFDVLRHTNQFQFEKTFQSQSRSSANDRKYVVTWPSPMEALTELYARGSKRDGRVELSGLLDGIRQSIPVQSRFNFAGKHPSVVMEIGFMTRDQRSLSLLRQAINSGGVGLTGDPVTSALQDVCDADYSRYSDSYRRSYRRAELSALGVFLDNSAQYIDPLVNKEELGTDVFPDGFHSSIFRMPMLGNRMVVLAARQRLGEVGIGGGNVKVGASGRGTRSQNTFGNVPYYIGGLAFWVKLDFDGDDPVFSGLIGCTQVVREVVPAAQDFTGSEGQQFFVFKNSLGQLRIVRMYYHQAFPEFGGAGGGAGAGDAQTIQLYPDPGFGNAGGAVDANNPILDELDPQKTVSRSDILIDISHFKAHEWHHVAIDWNDENPAFPIRLYLDFQEVREAVPRRPQQIVDGTANSWVRLNERQPKDGLQIGGIVRAQGVADAGIFKWFTNSTSAGRGGGVVMVAPSIKRILANATIDEVITYDSTFASAKSYYGGRGQPGYFTNQTGEYANMFEIPIPPEVDKVVLRSLDWTSYYPVAFTDSLPNSQPTAVNVQPMTCEVSARWTAAPPAPQVEPWRQPTVDNFVAGREVQRQDTGIVGSNAEVVYKFKMTGARALSGNVAGGVVQTPVIDDVTLTYFLPSPRILLQEDEF